MGEDAATSAARHVEAYIRLEAATCEQKVRQGLATMVWHDHLGEYCGTVSVRNMSQSLMLIHYAALAPGSSGYATGETLLALQRAATNPHYAKPYFTCPGCTRRIGQVVLAQEKWACRVCHRLGYRSQRLGSAQARQRRFDTLIQLLHPVGGAPSRPRYMRAARFAQLCAEYAALKNALEGRPRQVPARSLGLTLTATWQAAAFAGGI